MVWIKLAAHSYSNCPFLQIDRIAYLEAADAKKQYPELYTKWREDPANFHVNGIYPIRELWGTARQAWEQILLTPVSTFPLFSSGCALAAYYIQGFDISFRQGENFLVVTHKSILRALICTALGLPPERQVRPAFLSLQFRTLCAALAVENRDLYIAICQQSLSFPSLKWLVNNAGSVPLM